MPEARRLSAEALRAMLLDKDELALLDVREERIFSEGHLLFARSLPLSRLELRMARLVPRRATRIVLVDAADGLAERAAKVLATAGYTDLHVLTGGIGGWAAPAVAIFSGATTPGQGLAGII